jgi:APA family basic amino acid/polyamine antiporter
MTATASDRPPLHGEAALVRVLGPFALGASIVNIIVGAGIFMLPALLLARMGEAAPVAFLAGALAIIPVALCFAAVGSRVDATGGPYMYASAAFGPFAGFIAGALMWISNVASSAGVAAALAEQAGNAWPVFGDGLARAALLVGVYIALFSLNAFGVKLGSRAINLLATLKLLPLIALVLIGLAFVDWGRISWATPLTSDAVPWSALGASMVFVVFAYSGMETALIPSGEVRDPSRHVPRATLGAIMLVVALYVGIQVVCQGVLGPALEGSSAPIAQTAGALWAPGRGLLLATAAVSMTGFLMGNLFASSRLLFALGRDGYLPRAFDRVDARWRVPRVALAAHASVALLLALAGNFEVLALVSGGAICLLFVTVALAAWRAQARGLRTAGTPFVLPGGGSIPLVAAATMTAICATLSAREWLAIGGALAVLGAVYAALVRLRSRQPGPAAALTPDSHPRS